MTTTPRPETPAMPEPVPSEITARMNVKVHLYSQAMPIFISDVRNTYVKAGLFCVMRSDGSVDKFPVQHIYRINESKPS